MTFEKTFRTNFSYDIGGVTKRTNQPLNEDFTFTLEVSKDRIYGTLRALKPLTMRTLYISEERWYGENDLFFANGFQSWTTTREWTKHDTLPGLNPVFFNSWMKDKAGLTADYSWGLYGREGIFNSYTFCYFRKKESPNIKLYGSRTERHGYTIFTADMHGLFTIRKEIDGLELKEGQEYEVFDICIVEDDYDTAFDKYFFDFLGVKKPKVDRLAGYTSWYNYYSKISEDIILRDLDAMDPASDLTQIFQIDDGFQTKTGDWLDIDPEKFPHGLQPIVEKIHAKGYKAGLWLAPYCAAISSKVAKAHPEWMIKNPNGKPRYSHFGWGGAYAMDIYNEEARAYIKHFFDVVLNEWGFDMVKLDFLFTQAELPRNGKTRGEIMCDGIDFLRECCGDKIILGCGVPLGPCFGIFDACRIGADSSRTFEGDFLNKLKINNEIPCSYNAVLNSVFRHGLDGRAFANDPDVFFLRDENLTYTLEQKMLLAKVNDITGSILFVSDNMGNYDTQKMNMLRHIFEDKKSRVLHVEPITTDDIEITFEENGERKVLSFNLKNGTGNVSKVF